MAKNKTELSTLIADTLVEAFKDSSETAVVTRLQNVVLLNLKLFTVFTTTPTNIYVNPKNLNFGFRTGGQNNNNM